MNVRDLLVDLNKEFYAYKNDIFFTKFFKRTGSTCKVNTKSASISPLTYRPRSIMVQWVYVSNLGLLYLHSKKRTTCSGLMKTALNNVVLPTLRKVVNDNCSTLLHLIAG